MESTVLPRDLFRASLILVLGEVPTHGYDLRGQGVGGFCVGYAAAISAMPAAS